MVRQVIHNLNLHPGCSPGWLHLHVMCPSSSGWPTATVTVCPARGTADLKGITRDMWLWKKGRMTGSLQRGVTHAVQTCHICMNSYSRMRTLSSKMHVMICAAQALATPKDLIYGRCRKTMPGMASASPSATQTDAMQMRHTNRFRCLCDNGHLCTLPPRT